MRRHLVTVLLVGTVVACGCSVPDGDDMDRLTTAVSGWSAAAKARVVNYAMNRRALEWAGRRPPDDEIGRVMCYRDDNSLVEVSVRTVTNLLECLLAHPELTYVNCVDEMNEAVAHLANGQAKAKLEEKFGGPLSQCFSETSVRYRAEHVDDPLVTDPEAWSDEDIARTLIAMPGPLPGGAFPGLLPVLCPLSEQPESWGCPAGPSGPPGQTPGDEPGGDR
ncbi:hypothetical protein WME98_49885 [Sorangium sp. So ce296]|uniref:hypothetical protein n=1 Tax=Sorangium sp. So ce296 TaxID=3133296 RepID=UPI003F6447A0